MENDLSLVIPAWNERDYLPRLLQSVAAARAAYRIVAFADVDFRIAPDTFNYIVEIMSHDDIVGGATGLTIISTTTGIRTASSTNGASGSGP